MILLSHNGMDVDLKLAGRVSGIDVILGGHTHDAMPVAGARSRTRAAGRWSPMPARNGKFLAVLDLEVKRTSSVAGYHYRLLPVFSHMLACRQRHGRADRQGAARPMKLKLGEKLAVTEGLLYRRGNFNGTFDQLILDALMAVAGRRDRVLARLPLGHVAVARMSRLPRARDESDGDHLSIHHAHRADRRARLSRSSRTSATTCSIPTPTTSRAATWCGSAA